MKFILAFVTLAMASDSPRIPNDTYFAQQWSLKNTGKQVVLIDQDKRHTIEQTGTEGADIGWLDARDDLNQRATHPVTVAVIDSGVESKHPDLEGRLLPGFDFITNTDQLIDETGHGTHVSGIIAANADNALGVAGVGPKSVSVMPLRILSSRYKDLKYKGKLIGDYAADAINFAIDHHATIINMSNGWPRAGDTANARAAVQKAINAGILVVAAAGNNRKSLPTYPCSYEGVLCVGAITNTGALALFSNWGGFVDLLAPGDRILSTYSPNLTSRDAHYTGYEYMTGTSQAAPQVAGVAAALRSIFPQITLEELKARLLASGATLPSASAALYGSVNIKRAIDLTPRPVYLPNFKSLGELFVDDTRLLQGSLTVRNLWRTTRGVRAKIQINGVPAGSAIGLRLGPHDTLEVPWSYRFESLDAPSDFKMTLTVSDNVGAPHVFTADLVAARALKSIKNQKLFSLGELPSIPAYRNVTTYGLNGKSPKYYLTTNSADGVKLDILDPFQTPSIKSAGLAGLAGVVQVIRLDVNADGQDDLVVTGLGQGETGNFIQFSFYNSDLDPLYGTPANSTWRMNLDPTFGETILRNNFALAGSWLRESKKNRLLPSFIGYGPLPEPDNFDSLDLRHYRSARHFYYLTPIVGAANDPFLTLEVRAVDRKDFWDDRPEAYIASPLPPSPADLVSGRFKFLVAEGDGIDPKISILDVQGSEDYSVGPSQGWDAYAATGRPLSAPGPHEAGAMLSYFDTDGNRGQLAWANKSGQLLSKLRFEFSRPANPIGDIIGIFDLNESGYTAFFESQFDLVAFRQSIPSIKGDTSASVLVKTLPIERDITFTGYNDTFAPVLVGTRAKPLPGVFIDSTQVRGNRVSVAIWNEAHQALEKPLRYVLEVPDNCTKLPPAQITPGPDGFVLPLLCRNNGIVELRLVSPAD